MSDVPNEREEIFEQTAEQKAIEAGLKSKSLLKRLYYWTLQWAYTPYAIPALALIAFAESSFFPIPPDVLLLAMAFARPAKGFIYALACSVGSVAGGIAGWAIGFWFFEAVGEKIIAALHLHDQFIKVEALYQGNAFLAILAAAFTPIPYKVFTIAAGVFHVNLLTLFAASVIGRPARFFLVAGMIYFFGPRIKPFLEKYFELFTLLLLAAIALGFFAVKYVF